MSEPGSTFKYHELSESIKARLRQSFDEDDYPEYEWQFDDFVECGALLGIEIGHNGGVQIHFSGFSSQGDGASFVGEYACAPTASADIRAHAPLDETLHKIADELTALQVRTKIEHGDQLKARITVSRGRYSHSRTMDANVYSSVAREDGEAVTTEEEEAITKLMRRFADWIYRQLEDQYSYLHSNEYLDETIADSDETYDKEGNIVTSSCPII